MRNNNLPLSTSLALNKAKQLIKKYRKTPEEWKNLSIPECNEIIQDLLESTDKTILYVMLGGADIGVNDIFTKVLFTLINTYQSINAETTIDENYIALKNNMELLFARLPELLEEAEKLKEEASTAKVSEIQQTLQELFPDNPLPSETIAKGKADVLFSSLRQFNYRFKRSIDIKNVTQYCLLNATEDPNSKHLGSFFKIENPDYDIAKLWSKEDIEQNQAYDVINPDDLSIILSYAITHNDDNYILELITSYPMPARREPRYQALRDTKAYLEAMRDNDINKSLQAYLNLETINKLTPILSSEAFVAMKNQILGKLLILEEQNRIENPNLKKFFTGDLSLIAKYLQMMKAHKHQMMSEGKDTINYDKTISHYKNLYNKYLYLDNLKKSISGYVALGVGVITTTAVTSYVASDAIQNVLSAVSINNVLEEMHKQFGTIGKIYMPGMDSVGQAVVPALVIGITTTILSVAAFTAIESLIRYGISKNIVEKKVQNAITVIEVDPNSPVVT